MSISKCVVKLKDGLGTEHSAVVYPESLYEAVVKGLKFLSNVRCEGDGETISRVEVEVHQEPTRHVVNVPNLLKWIGREGNSPAQRIQKEKLRKLLGSP